MTQPLATCVWDLDAELVVALHERIGPPVDSYANGSQTWLRSDGPGGMPIEWRLHPQAAFARPGTLSSHHLFPAIAHALAAGESPEVTPAEVWTGLEAAPAYGDEVEPEALAECLTAILGRAPDAHGRVDRDALGRAWERSGGHLDIVARLRELLAPA